MKINPTLAKLEQAKAYLKKVLPNHSWNPSSKPPSTYSTPHSSPMKTLPKGFPPRSDTHHQALSLGKSSSIKTLALSFHKVSLHTDQIVVVMETEAHPMRPSVTASVSAMTGSLNIKSGPRIEGEYKQTKLKNDVIWAETYSICSPRSIMQRNHSCNEL